MKDDTDLRVTICHIREDPFRSGAHIFMSIQRCFVLLPLLQLTNAISTSLPMHYFHRILTSLISQALLQAVLDEVAVIFSCWFLHREFLKVTSHEAIARQPPGEAVWQHHRRRQYGTRDIKTNQDRRVSGLCQDYQGLAIRSSVSASNIHGSSSSGKSAWHK
jgi:hypothetical protein